MSWKQNEALIYITYKKMKFHRNMLHKFFSHISTIILNIFLLKLIGGNRKCLTKIFTYKTYKDVQIQSTNSVLGT